MACDDKCPTVGQGRSLKICKDPNDPCSVCQKITAARVVKSEELLRGERELFIIHQEKLYRLLHTKNGKLILHK